METVVAARDLHKSFGRREILRGVSLEVPASSLVAVIGENGAGKSTLLRLLAGTLDADAGSVEVHGRIGYCPQQPVLNDALTVQQHLRYFAAAYGLPDLERADALLDALGFAGYRAHRVEELSG